MSMDFKEIQELLRYINKSNLVQFELEQGDFKLKIVRQDERPQPLAQPTYAPQPQVVLQPRVEAQPQYPLPQAVQQAIADHGSAGENPAPRQQAPDGALAPNHRYITSPMIGTFYRSASPDKPSFVNVGDSIAQGQTLCIIEAMKLFNEIESELSGKIVKILVENAQPVEYDQPLFVVEV
ncbi:MAG: acetyl-CoA carboxylase biotin carboxyl carrier protein [Bacteroidia bacterium]|nr:acetyl-CoA carboxylase biotin carboxyl carrier protein [Bacteroidia bacterium]